MVVDRQPGTELEGPHGLGLLSGSQMSLKPCIGSNMVWAWIRVRVLNRISRSNFSQKGKPLFLFIFTISLSSNLRELSTRTLAHRCCSATDRHSGNCSGEPKLPFKSPTSLFFEDRFGTIEGGPKRSSQDSDEARWGSWAVMKMTNGGYRRKTMGG
ncbi:hypothetical protein V6N12_033030 [Hibiscus sabdariffa]|uniref:Uncharacterized protein n=1 Tax=Hibiscus sabdariffa TaxID=183260 RepID=A0ABR2CFK8_9ROSI